MIRRSASALLLVGLAVAALVVAWPSLFGLAAAPFIVQLVGLRALSSVSALLVVVILIVLAALWPASRGFLGGVVVICLGFAAINLAVLSSRGFATDALPAPAADDLVVLSWNTAGDATGVQAIVDLALKQRADVVVLPETTEVTAIAAAELMRENGRPMWVHSLMFDPELELKARSTSVLISVELGEYARDDSLGNTSVLPSIVLRPVSGAGPTIIGVHPISPVPEELVHWQSDLEWLDRVCQGEGVIMAGDLNATPDHFTATPGGPGLGSCVDTGLVAGSGAVGTWPTRLPALLGAAIDHVLVTADFEIRGFRVITSLDGAGSDHRPIVAHLRR
jgi:endonuclease/exonuclease/phosphatase (EEP) superfamily protein YafD